MSIFRNFIGKNCILNLKNTKCGLEVIFPEESLQKFQGKIYGAEGTPYEHGIFTLEFQIPNEYPHKPPIVKFITKIWHPNISSVTGCICLDILQQNWYFFSFYHFKIISFQYLQI